MDIITEIMKREGWDKFTNHGADRGGPTKWGITQKAWSAYIGRPATAADIRNINEEQARDFYTEEYVLKPNFFKIINQNLRELVVDCGVNHGQSRASHWLQEAVGATSDGVVGPKTLARVNEGNPLVIFLRILAMRGEFYGRLVTNDPSQAVFAAGWNARVAGFLEAAADRVAQGMEAV